MKREEMIQFIERVVALPEGHVLKKIQSVDMADLDDAEIKYMYDTIWLMTVTAKRPRINEISNVIMDCVLVFGNSKNPTETEDVMFCDSNIFLCEIADLDFSKEKERKGYVMIISEKEISDFLYEEDKIWKFAKNYDKCFDLVQQRVTEYVDGLFEQLCEGETK